MDGTVTDRARSTRMSTVELSRPCGNPELSDSSSCGSSYPVAEANPGQGRYNPTHGLSDVCCTPAGCGEQRERCSRSQDQCGINRSKAVGEPMRNQVAEVLSIG